MLKDLFERVERIGITKVAVGDLSGIRDGNNPRLAACAASSTTAGYTEAYTYAKRMRR